MSQETQARAEPGMPPLLLIGVLAAIVAIIGTFLAWATLGPISVAGIKGDGKIVAAAAVLPLALCGVSLKR